MADDQTPKPGAPGERRSGTEQPPAGGRKGGPG